MKNIRDFASSDSILFDLDGTLWDASKTATEAWNDALAKIGHGDCRITVEELRSFTGIKIETILHDRFGFMGADGHEKFMAAYRGIERDTMRRGGGILYPGVATVLGKLKDGRALFIVSNCLTGYIENFLDYTGLGECFAGYESTGRTGKSKSENIRKVMRDYKLKKPFYVGDTAHDFQECSGAGIPFVHAAYGFGRADGAEYRIEKFGALLALDDGIG